MTLAISSPIGRHDHRSWRPSCVGGEGAVSERRSSANPIPASAAGGAAAGPNCVGTSLSPRAEFAGRVHWWAESRSCPFQRVSPAIDGVSAVFAKFWAAAATRQRREGFVRSLKARLRQSRRRRLAPQQRVGIDRDCRRHRQIQLQPNRCNRHRSLKIRRQKSPRPGELNLATFAAIYCGDLFGALFGAPRRGLPNSFSRACLSSCRGTRFGANFSFA
jgi:hypothetical protein